MEWVIWLIIVGVGLVQLPFWIDIISSLFPRFGITRFTQKLVTVVLVGGIVMLIFLSLKQFLDGVLPRLPAPAFHCVLVAWLWPNTIVNFLGAVFTSPGYSASSSVRDENGSHSSVAEKSLKVCRSCNSLRYVGTRHCSVCKRCVQLMDHHCPFTRNCVGVRNYSIFLSFLVYCLAGLIYASVMTSMDFWKCWVAQNASRMPSDPLRRVFGVPLLEEWTCRQLGGSSFVFLPVFVTTLMVFSFVAFHVFLLWLNLSTIDFFSCCHSPWSSLWHRLKQKGQASELGASRSQLLLRQRCFWRYFLPGGLIMSVRTDRDARTWHS